MKKKFLKTFIMVLCIVIASGKNTLITNASANDKLVNVALNKPIEYTTGSPNLASYSKENLVDGKIYNIADVIWDGEHTGVGYIIDLGKDYNISEFKIYAYSGNSSGRDQIWIELSTDKTNWTNVCSRNYDINDDFGSSNMMSNMLTVNNFGTISARYVKLTSYIYGCWTEFEVYAVFSAITEIIGATSPDNSLKFISKATIEGEPEIATFGTTFIPLWLFEANSTDVATVEYNNEDYNIQNGQTYGATLKGIPESFKDIEIVGKSYIKTADGNYKWSSAEYATVNNTTLNTIE